MLNRIIHTSILRVLWVRQLEVTRYICSTGGTTTLKTTKHALFSHAYLRDPRNKEHTAGRFDYEEIRGD